MQPYQHILLATDLGKNCKHTARQALSLAEKLSAKLSIVHVVEPIPSYAMGYIGAADIENQIINDAKNKLSELGEELEVPLADLWIEKGPAKHEIVHLAKKQKVDLIIVGSHPHHGLGNLLGSTADGVMHHAECAVLAVRG